MGVETPKGWLNTFLMRHCLALASVALVRDPESEAAAAHLSPGLHVVPGVDLTFLLASPVASTRQNKLIVSVLPYARFGAFGAAAHERYLSALADAIDSLPPPHRPERVQILGMYSGHKPNDIDVARDLAARVRTIPVETTVVSTPSEALREISSGRAILTGRYHALLFAYLVDTPVGAISHQPKIASLCRVIGLHRERWATLDEVLLNDALRRLVLTTMDPVLPLPPKSSDLASAARTALRQFLDEVAGLAVPTKSR
jgi:polysaccharide pyruvyl transferase WcaK-like protein